MVASSPKKKSAPTAPIAKHSGKSIKSVKSYRAAPKKDTKDMFSKNALTRCIRAAGICKAKHRNVYHRLYAMMCADIDAIVKPMVLHTQHAERVTVSHEDLRQGLAEIGIVYC
jgi:histone H3/H4